MTKTIDIWNDIEASAAFSCFTPEGGVGEVHAILQVEGCDELFAYQLDRLLEAERRLMERPQMNGMKAVFKRYFLSDAVNQAPLIPVEENCSVSLIQQPPLNGSRVALWIYFVDIDEVCNEGGTTIVKHNGYEHLWNSLTPSPSPTRRGETIRGRNGDDDGDSYGQAEDLLRRYESILAEHGATIAENCIRTWFFVRDVDIQYKGLVDARREYFEKIGLTKDTHYIASTGIGGTSASRKAIHQMGAYAVKGLAKEQIVYLQAADNMNRTSDYGVTFERGTKVMYGDRAHLFVSGTASIDNRGKVVHEGDICKQTERMWANVEALLKEGGQDWDDVMQIIVYLRDTADANIVRDMFTEKFPDTPFVITLAPVCRPEWLIEMECIGVAPREASQQANF